MQHKYQEEFAWVTVNKKNKSRKVETCYEHANTTPTLTCWWFQGHTGASDHVKMQSLWETKGRPKGCIFENGATTATQWWPFWACVFSSLVLPTPECLQFTKTGGHISEVSLQGMLLLTGAPTTAAGASTKTSSPGWKRHVNIQMMIKQKQIPCSFWCCSQVYSTVNS